MENDKNKDPYKRCLEHCYHDLGRGVLIAELTDAPDEPDILQSPLLIDKDPITPSALLIVKGSRTQVRPMDGYTDKSSKAE